MRIRFTEVTLRNLPFTETGQKKYWDTSVSGFGLIVGKRTKTFVVMFGTARSIHKIGHYPKISLSEARKSAKVVMATLTSKTRTDRHFEALRLYVAECEAKNRPETVRTYRHHLNKIVDKKLIDIKATDINLNEPHAVTAWKVYFNWCMRNELVERNPFQHIPVKYNKRDHLLTPEEIAKLWHYDNPPFSDIIKLLILTGQRRSEIWKLKPAWVIDDTITTPATVSKNRHIHTYPFGDMARPYVEKAPFSFNSWSKAKARIDKETGVTGWVIHDIRRFFATAHVEKIRTPVHIIETHLNHRSGTISGVAAIYMRANFLDEMRQATKAYEAYIKGLL